MGPHGRHKVSSQWPFKGKPTTNNYIQVLVTAAGCMGVIGLTVMWPGPVLLVCGTLALGSLVRYMWNDIKQEWP